MSVFRVIRKADGALVYRYEADQPIEWDGMGFATHDHVEELPEPATSGDDPPEEWRVFVGSFYDRFGAVRFAILASEDPEVQAFIKDSSVRRYIDLKERRAELLWALGMLQSKGFAVTPETVLDAKPTAAEVYRA